MDINTNPVVEPRIKSKEDAFIIKSRRLFPGHIISARRNFQFQENKSKYLALCQCVHIKWLTIIFVTIKCIVVAYFVLSKGLAGDDSTVTIAGFLLLGISLLTYTLLVVGILKKTYTFVIPYFTVCILVVFMASMKFLVDILDLINEKKQSLRTHIVGLVAEAFLITFEVYSMVVVWRVLNYIMDYQMEEDLFFSSRGNDMVRHAAVIESGGDVDESTVDDPEHNMRHAYVLWQTKQPIEQARTAITILDDDDESDFATL